MVDTAEHERKLQQGTANALNVSPESLDPTYQSILGKLKELGADVVGETGYAIKTEVAEKLGTEVNLNRGNPTSEWLCKKWSMVKKKAASFRRKP